jgi:hypothetical protein
MAPYIGVARIVKVMNQMFPPRAAEYEREPSPRQVRGDGVALVCQGESDPWLASWLQGLPAS